MPELMECSRAALLAPPPTGLADPASLFLDFDGTLVDIAPRPDAVRVDAALARLIRALAARLDGRVAIVSGRGAAEIDALFDRPGIPIAGSHGAELTGIAGAAAPMRPAALDTVADRLLRFAATIPGLIVEEKPLGIGLHYRGVPGAEAAARALTQRLAAETGLTLQRGKMVFELRAPGDKGAAIAALMAAPPFADGHPLFLGDDLTDEPGFATVARLGGWGILVGPPRASAARYHLPDVAAARDWLTRFAGATA